LRLAKSSGPSKSIKVLQSVRVAQAAGYQPAHRCDCMPSAKHQLMAIILLPLWQRKLAMRLALALLPHTKPPLVPLCTHDSTAIHASNLWRQPLNRTMLV
jgi:hypothetical protein